MYIVPKKAWEPYNSHKHLKTKRVSPTFGHTWYIPVLEDGLFLVIDVARCTMIRETKEIETKKRERRKRENVRICVCLECFGSSQLEKKKMNTRNERKRKSNQKRGSLPLLSPVSSSCQNWSTWWEWNSTITQRVQSELWIMCDLFFLSLQVHTTQSYTLLVTGNVSSKKHREHVSWFLPSFVLSLHCTSVLDPLDPAWSAFHQSK